MTLSSPVSGTISELGEKDTYTFSGTAGQRLFYDSRANNTNSLIGTLFSPSGAQVDSRINTDIDDGLVTLTESGAYQLIVESSVSSSNSTGDYDFQLIDAGNAPAIALDTVVNGTLVPGRESDFYRFTAMAGQRLVFDAISGSGANFRVFDAGNTQIDAGGINFDNEFTLPEAGTYLLEIEGNSTTDVNYSFQLVTPTTTNTALTLSSPVSGTISELGEKDTYTFSGTAGQRLLYDSRANNSNSLIVSLFSPSGAQVGSTIDTDVDGGLVTLTESGAYQLIVESNVGAANSTGDYDFQLIDAGNAPAIALDTVVNGILAPGRESDFYRFTGTAGQRLNFDSLAGASGANWRFYNPANQQITATTAGSDFSAFLASSGTYLLEIEGNSANNVSYSFNVTDVSDPLPPTTAIFPISQSGTVPPSPTDFPFTAAAGELLLFDSLDPDFDAADVQILDPLGTAIYSSDAWRDSAGIALTRSGNYTIRITGIGDYDYRLLNLQSGSTPLVLGATLTGPLPAAEALAYSFTGSTGQRLYYDALEEDSDDITASLLRPDGTITLLNQSAERDGGPFTLTENGTHYLLLKNNVATAADYNFRLSDLASISPVSIDILTSGSLSPGLETDLYRLTGTAGQRLVFDSQTTFVAADWTLYGPANQIVSGTRNLSSNFEVNLTADGTYALVVDGRSATDIDYGFNIVTPEITTSAFTLNTPVSGTIVEPGEEDIYTFTGSVGQRLFYDALKNDTSDSFFVRLIDPTGDIVFLNQQADSDRSLFTLTEAGTYQLVFDSDASGSWDTGSYNFQLLDVAAASPVSFDTATIGSLSPGQETDLYRFTGTAGQRLVFDSQTTSVAADWTLYGPANQIVSGTRNLSSNFEVNLTADGTYALVVDGRSATDIDYSFNIVTPEITTSAFTLNTPVSGTIDEPGEEDIYTFTGSVGQRLFYDALKNDTSDSFFVRLIDPTGDIVFLNQQADSDRSLFTLTEAGTYQLVFDSDASGSWDTGSYNFQLLDVAAASPVSFDTVTNGTLSPGQETDLYRFTGTAGQLLGFDSQTAFSAADWTLYGPTNQVVSATTGISTGNISTDFLANLTADGTYALVVDGRSATDINYSFNIVTPGSPITGSPTLTVHDATGFVNNPIPLDIAASFAPSDGNDIQTILIADVPSDATLSNGINNGDGTWTLSLAQLAGLTITRTSGSNFTLTVTATGEETTLDKATTSPLFLNITLNTRAGITVTPTAGLVTTENGGTASFSVVLNSQPTADVTIDSAVRTPQKAPSPPTPSPSPPPTGTSPRPSPSPVSMMPSSMGMSPTPSSPPPPPAPTAPTTASMPMMSASSTPTTTPPASPSLPPPGWSPLKTAAPPHSVWSSIPSPPPMSPSDISSSDTSEGTLSTDSLSFSATDWNIAQTVTVTGVDDAIVDGDVAYSVLTAAAASTDSAYDGLDADDVSLINTDNDTAGITVTPTSGLVTTENGGTAPFTVVLNSQPTADVTIDLSSSDTSEGTLSTNSLSFSATDWNIAQTVTVTGVDDAIVDGDVAYSVLTAAAVSTDAAYDGFDADDVSLINTDNDTAGITVTPTSGLVTTENGGTASFSVVLNSQPTADVIIGLSSSDTTEGTLSTDSLSFSAADWNIAQTVTVTGVDDAIVDGNIAYSVLTAAAVSTDAAYNGFNADDVSLINNDNDTAGITVTPTAGLVTTENGGTASFSVVLNSQPTADVVIGLSSSDTTEGTLSTSSLSFSATDWNIAQTVTVTGVDDAIVDGDVAYSVLTAAAVSTDAAYDGFDADDVSLINTDNDTAGITVTPTSGLVTTENGGTASFSVVLNSQPTADVIIGLSSSDTTEGTLSTASLTFTAADWNVAQTVTVTGVDDAIVDGNVAYSVLTAAAVSTDAAYNGLDADDVSLINTDNDTAGITVTPTAGLVTTENGGTASFSVVLNSQPTADVTIGLSSSDTTEGTLSTSSLSFSATDWNIAQTVTVTGVDDAIVDGDVAYSVLTAAAVSTDAPTTASMPTMSASSTTTTTPPASPSLPPQGWSPPKTAAPPPSPSSSIPSPPPMSPSV